MAEMDGELIEFNSMLVRQLNSKESLIRRLKQELTDLRGPVSIIISSLRLKEKSFVICNSPKEIG